MTRNKTGIYIHIPFCVKKCNYCAFLSFSAEPETRRCYAEALAKEIRMRAAAKAFQVGKQKIDSVYIGGGTPSVLDASEIRGIMQAVKSSYEIKPGAEITIEANPGTLGRSEAEIRDKLLAYKEVGFTRLSMGVQSMDDDRLAFLGRVHSAEDVARDVRIARDTGFANINLDLIFSVPGERWEDALSDARKIIGLEPDHISCYSLQIEEGTPLAEDVDSGLLTEISDEEDRATYHRICTFLKDAGYEHYEISNFARPGMKSRHNSLYWDMSDYIGCGLGASGFENGKRYKNMADIGEYLASIDEGAIPIEEEYENTPFDNISEAVFTGLRREEGVSYEEACRAYAAVGGEISNDAKACFWDIFRDAKKEAEEFAERGCLIIDDRGLRLTEMGIDISNQIMALFV